MAFKRKEKEDTKPKNALSDLEVHLKYWEFVLAQFIKGAIDKITKNLEDWRNVASTDIVQILLEGFIEEAKPLLKNLIKKMNLKSAWKQE
ncbi:MAG: hypothetical protein ACW963_02870 [Candidatus Sifarchaeia archaeon]|jgi:hypothetical protein